MKKLIALLLAMMMVLCLVACGGEEVAVEEPAEDSAVLADVSGAEISEEQLNALAEAYNEVAPLYNEVYTTAEANGWLADELTVTELDAVGATLGFVAAGITEDPAMLDGSDFDALPDAIRQLIPELQGMLERVSVPYEAEQTEGKTAGELSDEELQAQMYALTEAYSVAAPLYNEVAATAEANGWLEDEGVYTALEDTAAFLGSIGTGLTEDISLLVDEDLEVLTELVQALVPSLEEIAEIVAVPYAG